MKRFAILIFVALFLLFLTRGVAPSMASARVYRIARDPTWFPLHIPGKEKNLLAFSDELLRRIAADEGFELQLIAAPWDTHIPLIEKKTCDAALTGILPTKRIRGSFDFSDPLVLFGPVLVVAADSPIKTLNDLQGMTLGVQEGAPTSFDLPKNSRVVIKMYRELPRAIDDLIDGKIEGVIQSKLRARMGEQGFYRDQIKVLGEPLNAVGLRLMTAENEQADFIDVFNEALKEFKRNGTYDQLIDKWKVFE